jgi:hypothetical protein
VNDLSKPTLNQFTSTRSTPTRSSYEHQRSQGIGHRQTLPTTGSLPSLSSIGIQRGSQLTTPRTMCIRLMFIISTHPIHRQFLPIILSNSKTDHINPHISYPVKSVSLSLPSYLLSYLIYLSHSLAIYPNPNPQSLGISYIVYRFFPYHDEVFWVIVIPQRHAAYHSFLFFHV